MESSDLGNNAGTDGTDPNLCPSFPKSPNNGSSGAVHPSVPELLIAELLAELLIARLIAD
jgi:hypothetical protein